MSQGAEAGAAAGGNGEQPFRVFKTQEEFQAEINAAEARARQQAERKSRGMAATEQEELAQLRREREEREQRDAEQRGEFEKARKLAEERHAKDLGKRDELTSKLTHELKTERIRRALVAEAAKAGAVDPELVADTLERRCALNEAYQAEATGEDGSPLTIPDLVAGFLSTKPFLVRPGSTGQGGGSRGGASMGADRVPGSPSLEAARQQLADAQKIAKASGQDHDLARVQTAMRRVKELEAAAKR